MRTSSGGRVAPRCATCSPRFHRATGRSERSCARSLRVPTRKSSFAERLTVRFSALAPINDPASLFKPIRKVIHRGHPEIHADARQPCGRRQPVRPAPRLVPGRGPALPAPLGRAMRAQGAAPGQRLGNTSTGRRPRTTRRCSRRSRRHDRRVLRGAGRHRRGGRARASRRAGSSWTRGCAMRSRQIARG